VAQALPSLHAESSLSRYLAEIRKFPILSAEEEFELAKRWRDKQDRAAAHKLVTAHLRLVAKIAMGYRGYGLPLNELIAEGNMGMMQAVKKFDPDKGFRLSTYAMWWIRASIQEYILHSWSLVKIGTTAAQKKLFFNLRRLKQDMRAIDDGQLSPEQVKKIARELVVSEQEVIDMNGRLSGGDQSLNALMKADGDQEWQDWLVDDTASQEVVLAERDEQSRRGRLLQAALATLNPRERQIFSARRLADEPETLEELSARHKVSRERIRQIEMRAFAKIQKHIQAAAKQQGLLPHTA